MQKALLIAEKPSAMNDIKKAYEKIKSGFPYDIDFTCCAGHLLSFCEPDEYGVEWGTPWTKEVLPMVPEVWKKKVINPKFYNQIKQIWQQNHYDVVINAGDAGREGQLIQHLVYEALGVDVPILRYWADDTTEKTVIKALNNLIPDENYRGLTDASYLRAMFDWLTGMNFSRASTLSLRRNTRMGRVLIPTLALCVNRENAILSFTPINYFELSASFLTENNEEYTGRLVNPNPVSEVSSKYAFLDKKIIAKIKDALSSNNSAVITDLTEEDKIHRAPTLFNLPDLQKECSNKFGYTPAETLEIAQKLYDKHFLSYPRTESKCITTEFAREVPSIISSLANISIFSPFVESILNNKPQIGKALASKKYVDNNKVSDHPALTPTGDIPDMGSLSQKEQNVYTLIVCRFLGIFMLENIVTNTSITTSISVWNKYRYDFYSVGSVEKQSGWKEILKLIASNDKKKEVVILPKVSVGENVTKDNLSIDEKATVPPKRYDNATIIDAMETAGRQLDDEELEKVLMECAGLGTPATRAEILEKLVEYEYIARKGKTIYPTEQGIELIKVLSDRKIVSPELTAIWEKKLKEVEKGIISYNDFYNAMIKYIKVETDSLLTLSEIGPYYKKIGVCPKCKKRDFVSHSNFYSCLGYLEASKNEDGSVTRACDFGLPKIFGGRPLTESDAKQLINGETTKEKEYTWKNGKTTTTSLILTDFKVTFPDKSLTKVIVGKCPDCGGNVIKGKAGYYCEEWNNKNEQGNPKCNFTVYGKIGESDISAKSMSQILELGETKKEIKVKWKSGKSYSGKLILEKYEGKYRVNIKPFERRAICECPYCKLGTLWEEKFAYQCDNLPSKGGSCLISIPKRFFDSPISEDEAIRLIKGEKIIGKDFVSKKGKAYKGNVYTVIDEQKGFNLQMEFFNKYKK